MVEWYDKLTIAGLVLWIIAAAMFITGLWFAMDAKNKAVASYKAAIQDVLRTGKKP